MGSLTALIVNGEIAAVITAMRQNVKWSNLSERYADEELEEPLLEELKVLRRNLFSWTDWSKVEPLQYLSPFLEVIKSPETSGPITAVALTSVNRFLKRGVVGQAVAGVAEAIQVIADSVTQCKFEATYPASDDCVLYKILDVLVSCVESKQGHLLTDDNLINIFQACYRIGHYQTEKGRETSELLTEASRRAMVEMVHLIFSQLEFIQDSQAATPIAGHQFASRLQVTPSPSACGNATMSVEKDGLPDPDQPSEAANENGGADGAATSSATESVVNAAPGPETDASTSTQEHSSTNGEADAAKEEGQQQQQTAEQPPPPPQQPVVHHEIVSLLPNVSTSQGSAAGAVDGYGIQAMREILQFIVSLVGSAPQGPHQDLPAHGLDLMCVALEAAGAAFEQYEALITILQQDLIKAMFTAARQPSLACLAGVCQVALALYVHLGRLLLLQLEALIGLLILPLAEGKGVTVVEQQQAALEGILDFCHQPYFIRDIYLNLDCRVERENLFEQICALLSKTAFPVNGPLSAVHLQSLDGILAILSVLASQSDGVGSVEVVPGHTLLDPAAYTDIWTPLSEGAFLPSSLLLGVTGGIASLAAMARVEKHLKGRLAAAAEHFNRDHKKGFQYLQSIHLLPHALEPEPVARFLRLCPGLAKAGIGEVLGERDLFYEQVRQAFIETFRFKGMEFDTALRLFMDAFRPPGEGQKIDRIMQVFGKRYHDEMPSESSGLKSADAAYVLAFSVIMLNTDLHNTQNKKKMSLQDFSRINDNTNDGEPMPRELLNHIYQNIAKEELKISAECAADELPGVFWIKLSHESQRPRGKMLMGGQTDAVLERDMYSLIWGPTLAAVSVIMDNASDPTTIRRALDALLLAAKMADYHQVDEVVDSIVVSLSKFSTVLHPGTPKSTAAFGENAKARLALETMFTIANRYGDWLRSGWRNVLDCILRLHKLDLLPPAVIAVDGEEVEDAKQRWPQPSKAAKTTGSLFSRAINSLISIEGSDTALAEQAAHREAQANQRAAQCVENCRIDEIFADSKFLVGESLVELVKATMWAAGNVVAVARSGENTDSAELCLELLITLALRNRDRVALLWPLVHEFLAACTSPEAVEKSNALVERAVMGLLRVCHRLLPYKEDTAEMLMHSLTLVIGLNSNVAWELAERIATELLSLLKSSSPYVRTEADWKTVCAIVRLTSMRPDVVPLSYESLAVVCRNPHALSPASYMPVLETSLQFIARYKLQSPEMAVRYLDLIEAQAMWLVSQGHKLSAQKGSGAVVEGCVLSDVQMLDLWLDTVQVLTQLCTEECQPLRDSAIGVLHRTVQASDAMNLPSEIWVQSTRELLIPIVADLTRLGSPKVRTHPGAEKSVRLAVNMLVKVLLQYMDVMLPDKDFYALWQAALQALQGCMSVRHEGVLESVPENVKNMLLVMATNGILRPDWQDVAGANLWDLTFSRVHTISSGLNPTLLEAAGVVPTAAVGPEDSQPGTAAVDAEASGAAASEATAQDAPSASAASAAVGAEGTPVGTPAVMRTSSTGSAADAAAAAGKPPAIPIPAQLHQGAAASPPATGSSAAAGHNLVEDGTGTVSTEQTSSEDTRASAGGAEPTGLDAQQAAAVEGAASAAPSAGVQAEVGGHGSQEAEATRVSSIASAAEEAAKGPDPEAEALLDQLALQQQAHRLASGEAGDSAELAHAAARDGGSPGADGATSAGRPGAVTVEPLSKGEQGEEEEGEHAEAEHTQQGSGCKQS